MTLEEQCNEADQHYRIAARAYELYEARGRVDGYAEEDWLQAENEILNSASNQQERGKSPSEAFNSKAPTAKRKAMRR